MAATKTTMKAAQDAWDFYTTTKAYAHCRNYDFPSVAFVEDYDALMRRIFDAGLASADFEDWFDGVGIRLHLDAEANESTRVWFLDNAKTSVRIEFHSAAQIAARVNPDGKSFVARQTAQELPF